MGIKRGAGERRTHAHTCEKKKWYNVRKKWEHQGTGLVWAVARSTHRAVDVGCGWRRGTEQRVLDVSLVHLHEQGIALLKLNASRSRIRVCAVYCACVCVVCAVCVVCVVCAVCVVCVLCVLCVSLCLSLSLSVSVSVSVSLCLSLSLSVQSACACTDLCRNVDA